MGYPLRQAAVLGDQDFTDTRQNVEVVRNGETEIQGQMAKTGAKGVSRKLMSIINSAVDAVMDLIDALELFAEITRGALGTKEGLCCEVGPSSPAEVYLDKNQYIVLDLTINGKYADLETLSDAMNAIHESLTMAKSYPSGTDWSIVDITTLTEPQVIGRESSNTWVMASSLGVKLYTNKE